MAYYLQFADNQISNQIVMEDKIITLTREKISTLYNDSRILLLEQTSYHEPVDTLNVNLYFTFLESALKQPYNRLASLRDFIMDEEGLLTSLMYPFRVLYENPQLTIDTKFKEAQKLIAALETSEIDPTGQSLTDEHYVWYKPE